jgi:hypothetical protein
MSFIRMIRNLGVYSMRRYLSSKRRRRFFLYQTSLKRFLEIHGLDFAVSPDQPDHNVLWVAVGDLDPAIDQLERSIADLAFRRLPIRSVQLLSPINSLAAKRFCDCR